MDNKNDEMKELQEGRNSRKRKLTKTKAKDRQDLT